MINDITIYGAESAKQNTYELASTAPLGDFVECGVAYGGQLAIMHRADPSRIIWGFDSFDGIPLAGKNDTAQPGLSEIMHDTNLPLNKRLVSSGVTVHTLKGCEESLAMWKCDMSKINLVKGWFQHTLPNKVKKIALLRLDGDLYESTLVCLEKLYPLVVEGGWVIIDDYALTGCKKAVHDYLGDIELTEVKDSNGIVFFKK